MNWLLVCIVSSLAVFLLIQRWRTNKQLRRITAIVDDLVGSKRPPSFILHGNRLVRGIAFGLEQLADQRERMQRQISQEEFNLQAILSSMVEGVMVVDTTRAIRLVNASLMHLFELTAPPLGRNVLQTLRNATIEDVVRTALSSGEAESREIALDASSRHLAMSAAPVRDSAGTILGVAAIFHDITRLKQLEQVRREFVANVSHELRTPLSIFQGHLEMLLDDPDLPREDLQHSLQVLQKHSQRLNALVADLLTLARLESRHGALALVPVQLGVLLQGISQDWTLKFSAKNVKFRLDITPDLPPVMADGFRIEQVMYNLLENALKYTPGGGEVAIVVRHGRHLQSPDGNDPDSGASATSEPGEGEIELCVIDTGSGIPPVDLPHIFERFYRADKARSRALGGTGLGLSIVKHIVGLHGGTVHAESVYGSGTSIVIRLPAAHLIATQEVAPEATA